METLRGPEIKWTMVAEGADMALFIGGGRTNDKLPVAAEVEKWRSGRQGWPNDTLDRWVPGFSLPKPKPSGKKEERLEPPNK